jgi:glycosyltransferase involved in cell wall biosynthesis
MRQIERRKVDMFLPVSRAVATGSQLAGSGSPYQVIPNFIPDQFPTLPNGDDERLRALPADGYLMFVGDLTEQKGIHVLLRAYSELRDAPPLVLIGRAQPDTPTTLPPNVVVLNNWPHALVMATQWDCARALHVPGCLPNCGNGGDGVRQTGHWLAHRRHR